MGLHDGHRMRMREKLEKGSLLEHEILEVMLFNGVPRLNTNDIAHRLLAEFGSVANVFGASIEQLTQVDGVGKSLASYIHVSGLCYKLFYKAKVEPDFRPKEYNADEFLSFVKEMYSDVDREVLDVYALDENSRIIVTKRFSQDSLFNVEVSPEEISKFIMQNQVSGIVMVHNHPLGEAKPSESDDQMTMKCQLMCSLQNVLLCDHIIYAKGEVYSYYRSGFLKKISERYSVQGVLSNGLPTEYDE